MTGFERARSGSAILAAPGEMTRGMTYDQTLGPGCNGQGTQEELRDLLCIAVVGDHVRWGLTGDDITEFAQWLSGATGQWRAWADQVATRLVALGVAPDGRVRSLAKDVAFNLSALA